MPSQTTSTSQTTTSPPSTAPPPLMLLTGASGHLGFRTLVLALQHGFRVRAAVRSTAKAARIRAAKSVCEILGPASPAAEDGGAGAGAGGAGAADTEEEKEEEKEKNGAAAAAAGAADTEEEKEKEKEKKNGDTEEEKKGKEKKENRNGGGGGGAPPAGASPAVTGAAVTATPAGAGAALAVTAGAAEAGAAAADTEEEKKKEKNEEKKNGGGADGHWLEFVIVQDILAEGAYDEAVKGGVDFVVHTASPISFPTDNYERDLIQPAVKGTIGILQSAAKESSIKRVVITSSEVAIIPWKEFVKVEVDTVFTDKMSILSPQPPYANPFEAYAASKVHALHASEAFVASQNPHFDLINVMPSFIIGANELTTSIADMRTQGTNRHALTPLVGVKNPNPNPSTTVFVDDVAKIHVLALDLKIAGGQNFLVSSGGLRGTTWNDSLEIVRRWFPDEVARGVWPMDGDQPTKRTKVDSSRTEEVFGFKLAGYETQVRSVVGHYLELLEKA